MGQSLPNLLEYAKKLEDTALSQNVSQFPLSKALPQPDSFASRGETPPSHIPAFLPAFPDPHTLMETAQFIQTAHTTHTRQQQLIEQQLQGEDALLRIEAREHPENAPLQSAKQRLEGNEEAEKVDAAEGNAFLAPVLWEAAEPEETLPAAAAAPAAPEAAGGNVEWQAPAENGAAVDLNIDAFQLSNTGTRVALATSGRSVELYFNFVSAISFI